MKDFTQGSAAKQIIGFALPMLVGNVFQQLYNMADAAVVGRYVGGDALAAVGTSAPVMNFLISVMIGLTTGASVLISQFYGANQYDNLKRTVSTSLIFLCGLVIFISVTGFFGAAYFLKVLDVPENIFNDSIHFLRIMMLGLVFMLLYDVHSAYLRALGDSKNTVYILMFSTVLNVVLDLWFVIYFKMGVKGVAYATVIAQGAAAALCYLYVCKRAPLLRIHKFIFDFDICKSVLKYSIPAAVQLSVVALASLTIQRLVNGFGSSAIAGFTAATKVDSFATMPLSSISMAISIFVGQNMGAGLEARAKNGFKTAMLLMLGFGVCVSAISLLFGKVLISAFISGADQNIDEILAIAVKYLSIMAFSYSLFAIFFAFNGFFRGVGDAVIVMVLTITSLSIRSVSAHILVNRFGFGPEAVAWSIPIGWALCSIAAYFYYKKRMWAGKVAVKEVPEG